MSKYHDDSTYASHPGRVGLSRRKLREWFPKRERLLIRILRFVFRVPFDEVLDEHLHGGDSRAAVVVGLDPLRVAAFSDELDCVAILRFPEGLVRVHSLEVGSRLLTVNTYSTGETVAPDLTLGPRELRRYVNFYPVIAEFVSDNGARIAIRKRAIDEEEWARCLEMGQAYIAVQPWRARDGSPYRSMDPV